jgi:hypothetical protein
MNRRSAASALGGLSICLLISACTFKATTKETTDTTSNITGTTSGRVWWNEDGLLKQDHRVAAFTAYNAPNLEEDLARGQGEYLSSLGTLIGTAALDRFNPIAQDVYSRWRQSGSTSANELVRKVGAGVR